MCGKAIGRLIYYCYLLLLLPLFGKSETLVGLSWFKARLHRVRSRCVAEEDLFASTSTRTRTTYSATECTQREDDDDDNNNNNNSSN